VRGGAPPAGPRRLRVADWLAAAERMPCLDLRGAAEFARGHLPGAGNLPLAELAGRKQELPPPGTPLFLVGGELAAAGLARLGASGRWPLAWSEEPPASWPATALVRDPPSPLWGPNPWLAAQAARLRPAGRVLDLGMGSGRNAVWLAGRGFALSGIDRLPEAVASAEALARRHGVPLAARVGDARDPGALAPGGWDGILLIDYFERSLLPRLPAALAPGGLLIVETFLRAQTAPGGRPRRARWLLEPGELAASCAGALEILALAEGEAAPGRQVASLLARRPQNRAGESA